MLSNQTALQILLIEDEEEITELLTTYLAKFNMHISSFTNPQDALQNLQIDRYDLIILDLTLPHIDGLEVCKMIRQSHQLPIIISSARGDIADKVIGLDYGADDYLPKPYEPRELVARIEAQVRRYRGDTLSKGVFHLDMNSYALYKNDTKINLTTAELQIFQILYEKQGSAVSRDYIANNIEAIDWNSTERSIDVLISRIRRKIDDGTTSYIKSIRGVGYMLINNQ